MPWIDGAVYLMLLHVAPVLAGDEGRVALGEGDHVLVPDGGQRGLGASRAAVDVRQSGLRLVLLDEGVLLALDEVGGVGLGQCGGGGVAGGRGHGGTVRAIWMLSSVT